MPRFHWARIFGLIVLPILLWVAILGIWAMIATPTPELGK